jgi:DNA-binding PucR family transcriptional regulator
VTTATGLSSEADEATPPRLIVVPHDRHRPPVRPRADLALGPRPAKSALGSVCAGATLGDVLSGVGEFLAVMCAPAGLDRSVQGVMIWDPATPDRIDVGDLVLAVGIGDSWTALSELITQAGRAGAVGVVLKGSVDQERLKLEADRAGVAAVLVRRELAWDELHAELRVSVAAASCCADTSKFGPMADLFALADAASASLDCPVEIDDASLHLVAFSNLGHELDELRRASILRRLPPPEAMEWLRANGLLQRLREAYRPLRITPPNSRPRLVMPIRAGIDVLGYVWVLEGEDRITSEQEAALAKIAAISAAMLSKQHAAEDTDRRLRSDLLRSVINGAGSGQVLAARFGSSTRLDRFILIGFSPRDRWLGDTGTQLNVQNLTALRFELAKHQAAVVTIGDNVYALVQTAATTSGDIRSLVDEILAHAANQLGVPLVAAIGEAVQDLDGLSRVRREVDRILKTVAARGSGVATANEVRAEILLAELAELFLERPHMGRGPIAILRELDQSCSSEHLATLRAYFNAGCDLTKAAERLYIHRNSLRYRLRRIHELCGIDLEDPLKRLIAELQLRVAEGANV